ncbi:MAG: hypothetical protein HY269_00655 [Deltaproteobacteria bacterium]|nr:hypothetical protein [Deltaproteobacteria bacterium]
MRHIARAEQRGRKRLDLVATDLIEDAPHVLALELLERHSGRIGGCNWNTRVVQLLGQVVSVDNVGLGENRGALDRIFKFANIAGPSVADHHAHRTL